MYYKVIKDNKVIDVIDQLVLLKYLPNRKAMTVCDVNEAQAFLSSDNETIWHERTLHKIPVEGYDTVELVKINKYEYDQLKILNLKTPEAIIDAFVASLLEDNLL